MNTLKAKLILLLAAGLCVLSACEPKNEPRWTQEGANVWKRQQTPDEDVSEKSFNTFDLDPMYKLLNTDGDLTAQILQPLSQYLLNRRIVENPTYHTVKLSQMLNVFNTAFIHEFDKKQNRNPAFDQIHDAYYQTIFAGCSRDLRTDCINAGLFASESRFTLIMTKFARELDPKIEESLKASGSPSLCIEKNPDCRNLVEERYRRLAMGVYKSSRYSEPDFTFAYLKYARVFALYLNFAAKEPPTQSMSLSYINSVHGKIFETLISTYKPKSLDDPEFKAFVENFNPWVYSRKQADVFQYGTGVMFEFGTKCCLYQDAAKTQLSPSVKLAIAESQKDKDGFGLSFVQMVEDIKKEYGDRLFKKLGLGDLLGQIDNSNSPFFNEYFFIVDRLFRGHLSTSEIDMMLRNTNSARARVELPKMISNYIKVYLVYMVVETNRFMSDIYHSNLASNQIFEQAIVRSRDLTSRWYAIQAQIDLLDKLMNSYFKDLLITSNEYKETFNLLRAVNRNVHYISVYPNMIVMNYYLSKMKGKVTFNSWWGEISIDADTILKAFFDGDIAAPWFHFGKDLEPLDRTMLLYSLEYLLSTESMKSFVAKDSAGSGNDRSKFFELIFTQYLGSSVDELRKDLSDYKKNVFGSALYPYMNELCDYEMKTQKSLSRRVILNFLELDRFTYSGLGDNSVNTVLTAFMTGAATGAGKILDAVDYRKSYVQSMIDVIEGDLIRTGQIQKKGDPHPDLEKPRALIQQLVDIQSEFRQIFLSQHKQVFACALRLREIERRRANRLYDEEREHLGKIWDMMKPLNDITDSATLDAKVKELNTTYFRAKDSGYTFDQVDGMNYRLSKYDLLMRMKSRIEADIFQQPTEKETKNYKDVKDFIRPRSVSVLIPDGIQRSDMYALGTSLTVPFNTDRNAFIHDGMAALNGKSQAFIRWQDQMEGDKSFTDYLAALEKFYVMPPAPGEAKELAVTPEDLTNAYIAVVAGYTLDSFDMENAKDFQTYGHYAKDFFQGKLFEKDGMTRLPLFYSLMMDTAATATVGLEKGSATFDIGRGWPVAEALEFAKKFNSMQAFVFQPSETVRQSVTTIYGDRAHQRLNRVSELYAYLKQREAAAIDAAAIDPRLAQPVYLEGNTFYQWYAASTKNLVDIQRYRDHQILIKDFIQRSGNFFSTQGKVTVP